MSSLSHLRFFFLSLTLLFTSSFSLLSQESHEEIYYSNSKASSPFESSLITLQKQIGYNFTRINLLRRSMTHPSYSIENNRALSILGLQVIQTSISLQSLLKDIDFSPKDLNHRIIRITETESCAVEAMRLGLQNVIRVSSKTNSSISPVVCGGFRAMFGAIAVDSEKGDIAGNVFLKIHGGEFGEEDDRIRADFSF